MAIQLPDVGTGVPADKTGDSPWLAMKKVRENFNDQTNAASRLVGSLNGRVPLAEQVSNLAFAYSEDAPSGDVSNLGFGNKFAGTSATGLPPSHSALSNILTIKGGNNTAWQLAAPYASGGTDFYIRPKLYNGAFGVWGKIYTSNNTTIVNGSLKPSSPVVKIHTDSLELNADAEKMGVTLNKRGVGDYLLKNTTGLRNDGGWRIELPQDVNGNPYFAVDYNELENNDIEVKTYKRIFDMNTFMFVPDLDSPVDIKEGRSIAIRFNDLQQDDIQAEV